MSYAISIPIVNENDRRLRNKVLALYKESNCERISAILRYLLGLSTAELLHLSPEVVMHDVASFEKSCPKHAPRSREPGILAARVSPLTFAAITLQQSIKGYQRPSMAARELLHKGLELAEKQRKAA